MKPFLISPDTFPIPSYLFVISLAYCLGIIFAVYRARNLNLDRNHTLDFCLTIMIGGLIGARLSHVIIEYPQYYIENPLAIFKINQGGFVYYGGVFGSFLASALFAKIRKIPMKPWLDLFAPVFAFGYGLGRVACFLAGCCYGKECDLPWAVVFPIGVEAPHGVPLHPTQIYSVILAFLTLTLLLVYEKKAKVRVPGQVFYLWMILIGLSRTLVECFRADWRGDMLFGLSPSTWISLALIVCGAALFRKALRSSH